MVLQQQKVGVNSAIEISRYVKEGMGRSVGRWLLGTAGLCTLIVSMGGYTRLTESGLSMTDWKLRGRRLPNNQEEWEVEFNKYKETPEYREVHRHITLKEFKTIYFNEWFHRMLARGTGLFFLSGAVYFGVIQRAFTARMGLSMAGLLSLFLAQGLVGWWMVKSGFDERTEQNKTPRVSPYRLASHLVAATILFASLLSVSCSVLLPPASLHLTAASCAAAVKARRIASLLLLAPLTFVSGAFVAGNDAGHGYNTWPLMLDRFIPEEVYQITSEWKHIFENNAVVQFDHRMLAYSAVAANAYWFYYTRRLPLSPKPRLFAATVAAATGAQMVLGILTLLWQVPVSLGVLHQALGLGVVAATVLSLHSLRVPLWYLKAIKA